MAFKKYISLLNYLQVNEILKSRKRVVLYNFRFV